jgi:hypothetical protein
MSHRTTQIDNLLRSELAKMPSSKVNSKFPIPNTLTKSQLVAEDMAQVSPDLILFA